MQQSVNPDITRACEVMRRGGVILYPTDTVWGIGCDAMNAAAVARVFDIKQRADSKALIILLGDSRDLWRYVEDVPEVAEQLIEVADRPTTIIYDRGRLLAPNVMAEDGSVAIRITAEPFSAALCRAFKRPLVSTSANISGQPTPRIFAEIPQEIRDKVDYICEAQRDNVTPAAPSAIIKISSDSTFKIIRS